MLDLPDLSARMPAETALALIFQACGREVDQHVAAFLDSPDPDSPRKARVALRRLTTALDAFAPILRKTRTARLRRKVKDLFRRLGHVRDADLVLQSLPDGDRGLQALRAATAEGLRKSGAVTLGARLQGASLLEDLLRHGKAARKARRAALGVLAAQALTAARGRCLGHGADLRKYSDSRLHDLRKDLKTYRYLAEFFAACWPDDTAWVARRARFQALQDALGVLTDQAVIGSHSAAASQKAGDPDAAAARAQALGQAQGLWSELRGETPWWQGRGD